MPRVPHLLLAVALVPLLLAAPAAAHHRSNEATYVAGTADPTGLVAQRGCTGATLAPQPAVGVACFVTAPPQLQVLISVADAANPVQDFRFFGVKNDGSACGVSGAAAGSVVVSTLSRACTHFHVLPGAGATTGTIRIS